MEGSTGRQRLPKHVLAQLEFPLPPIAEQKAISTVLSAVQEAIEKTDAMIQAARQVKKSLMKHLFKYGPVSLEKAERVPLKETEIGLLPESWAIIQLGRIAKIGNGSTPKRTNANYWEGGTIPWLTSSKVHEEIIDQADEFVTELALKECHLPLVPANSLVVAITGQGKTLGNAALVRFDTCVNQHLAYLRLRKHNVKPEFVLFFLQSQYERLRQVSQSGGSTKGALTCGFLSTYPLPLPSFGDQLAIAAILSNVSSKIATEENRKEALQQLFNALMEKLMTGKIRVNESMKTGA